MHRLLNLESHLLLVVKQPAFTLDASAITGKRSVGTDDAMAGHHHADRVGAVGKADRTDGSGAADAPREFPVRDRRATGNLTKCPPDLLLERCAGGLDG